MRSPEAAAGASTDPALIFNNNPAYTVAQDDETQSQPAKEATAVRQKREAGNRSKRSSSRVVTMVSLLCALSLSRLYVVIMIIIVFQVRKSYVVSIEIIKKKDESK